MNYCHEFFSKYDSHGPSPGSWHALLSKAPKRLKSVRASSFLTNSRPAGTYESTRPALDGGQAMYWTCPSISAIGTCTVTPCAVTVGHASTCIGKSHRSRPQIAWATGTHRSKPVPRIGTELRAVTFHPTVTLDTSYEITFDSKESNSFHHCILQVLL